MRALFVFLIVFYSALVSANVETTTVESQSGSQLDQDFYKDFWQLDPSSSLKDMIIDPNYAMRFDEIIIKSQTGFGTGKTIDVKKESGPYDKILLFFNNCLSGVGSGAGCPESTSLLKDVRFAIASLEQCYANIPVDERGRASSSSTGLIFNGIQRNQTSLEKDLGLFCNNDVAVNVLKAAAVYVDFSPSVTSSSSTEDIKRDFDTLHSLLIDKLSELKSQFIQSVNSYYVKQSSSNIDNQSFVDKNEIDDSEINKVLNAYDKLVQVESFLPPITVFPRTKVDSPDSQKIKIIYNGVIKSLSEIPGGTDKLALTVGNKRNGNADAMSNLLKEQKEAVKSFGVLKKNAILSIASIIAERTKKGEHSMLYSIKSEIDAQLKASKTEKVNPSVLLKQIRDAINLNNKLSYMSYIVQERIQMAMAVSQISQLKPLADRINDLTRKINKLAYELDLGSEFEK